MHTTLRFLASSPCTSGYPNLPSRLALAGQKRQMSFSLPYKWISASELAELIKSRPESETRQYAVIDVRDSDFAGGNIVKALNYPSEGFYESVNGLVKDLQTVPKVIFRQSTRMTATGGPKAARIYAETRKSALPDAQTQEILVLREGFSGFQSKYRDDPELIEKFNKYYHD